MTNADPAAYYERATSWALDKHASMVGSVRRARLVAIAVGVIAVLEAFALILLTPLKSVSMVPVLVDRHTGFVERLNPDGAQELRANDALVQSLLAQYVTARESFDITTVAADYHKIALWSAAAAKRDYLAAMPASNPQSPLRRYPRSTLIETSIKSISPLGNHTALVRFETLRKDQNGAPSASEWAAVLGYRFSADALSASDRWLNPLGFEVVSYRRDPEAPLPAEAPASSAPAVASTPPVLQTGAGGPALVAVGSAPLAQRPPVAPQGAPYPQPPAFRAAGPVRP